MGFRGWHFFRNPTGWESILLLITGTGQGKSIIIISQFYRLYDCSSNIYNNIIYNLIYKLVA